MNSTHRLLPFALALLTVPGITRASDTPGELRGDTARINYSVGYQIGGDFKRQGVAVDADAVTRGIRDALSGGEPRMTPQEMNATLLELKRRIVADQKARLRSVSAQKVAADKQYLEENRAKPGVTVLASGLQYRILEQGRGKTPSATDEVTVKYRGTLVDGQEFDSSLARGEPARFRLDGVIKGWTEGLQLIQEGGRIQLVVPPGLGYGNRGPLAHRTLLFDVELIAVADTPRAGETAAEH